MDKVFDKKTMEIAGQLLVVGVVIAGGFYVYRKFVKPEAEAQSGFRGIRRGSSKGGGITERIVAVQCPVNCDGSQQATFYLQEGQDCPPLPSSCHTS